MFATIESGQLVGVTLQRINIQVALTSGLPSFQLVGLPSNTVSEARARVQTALRLLGFEFPRKKIIVNLAPADVKKETTLFDLPIALGIVAAQKKHIAQRLKQTLVLGELSLDGRIAPMSQALSMAVAARQAGYKRLLLPSANAPEAAMAQPLQVYGYASLTEVCEDLLSDNPFKNVAISNSRPNRVEATVDFSQMSNAGLAARVATIAAVGRHNLRIYGNPGTGKSMMATRLPTILPNLSLDEALECSGIHALKDLRRSKSGLNATPPFRAPHHSVSAVGLLGGGSPVKPGEISLAHNGVLFLDELLEFERHKLEALRTPLEDGFIRIARGGAAPTLPARFMLIAAHNPCPCGYLGHLTMSCTCSVNEIRRYKRRLSGPMKDRFQLHLPLTQSKLSIRSTFGPSSAELRQTVVDAQTFGNGVAEKNTRRLSPCAVRLLEQLSDTPGSSFRRRQALMDVAYSIANLAASAMVTSEHLEEALQYGPTQSSTQKPMDAP